MQRIRVLYFPQMEILSIWSLHLLVVFNGDFMNGGMKCPQKILIKIEELAIPKTTEREFRLISVIIA